MRDPVSVFFYGLFMDTTLLAARNIKVRNPVIGSVQGYTLRIGARASLVPQQSGQAYGLLIDIERGDLRDLYADPSVAEYVPEQLEVVTEDGTRHEATCYNLPESQLAGTNPKYAAELGALANRLGLPAAYCEDIARQGH